MLVEQRIWSLSSCENHSYVTRRKRKRRHVSWAEVFIEILRIFQSCKLQAAERATFGAGVSPAALLPLLPTWRKRKVFSLFTIHHLMKIWRGDRTGCTKACNCKCNSLMICFCLEIICSQKRTCKPRHNRAGGFHKF